MMKPITIAVETVGRPKLSRDGRTMVISIPISMRRTGGRKKVVTTPPNRPSATNNPLIRLTQIPVESPKPTSTCASWANVGPGEAGMAG